MFWNAPNLGHPTIRDRRGPDLWGAPIQQFPIHHWTQPHIEIQKWATQVMPFFAPNALQGNIVTGYMPYVSIPGALLPDMNIIDSFISPQGKGS